MSMEKDFAHGEDWSIGGHVVFIDIDTQQDFMNNDGKLYVPRAEDIKLNLFILTEFAKQTNIKILATGDSHPIDDQEFESYPAHCIAGSEGARKINETTTTDPIYTKKTYDIFDPKLGNKFFVEKLRELNPDRVYIYGCALDICVAAAIRGIVKMNIPITLVIDASAGIIEEECEKTIQTVLDSKNGRVEETEDVVGSIFYEG